ncbi:helix-turn-helix domain-containing protein [Eubacterium pyruvativorans]|uniref:helix-turn-helix domain-containing protein n=1 Tax=Eubacterium pyruvativorans TaxID=155865 RepID=UPI001568F33B|nr:helix-turn-helix transcriptional regulator [Eubacterium pyruvativorans]
MTFGERLRDLRKERHVSQEQLADSINVSRQAISKWEHNLVTPDTENILLVCKYFNVPLETLIFDYDSKQVCVPDKGKGGKQYNIFNGLFGSKTILIIGTVIVFVSICGTYLIKYIDFTVSGSCYVNPIYYLFEFPLSLLFIVGIACLVIGGTMKIMEKRRRI